MHILRDVPSSIPLLLLHSALGTRSEMLPIAELFTDRTTYLLDFSGHGKNSHLPEDYSSQSLAEEVLKYLDTERLDDVDVIGYSLGGYVAIQAALLEQKTGPRSIRSIVSHAMKFYWEAKAIASAVDGMKFEELQLRAPTYIDALDRAHSVGSETVLKAVCALISDLSRRSLSVGDIASLEVPLLLTTGELDSMVPPGEVRILADEIRRANGRAEARIIDGVKHPIKTLDLPAFERLVRTFWKDSFEAG